jgi:uncharacterized protein with GYD domain
MWFITLAKFRHTPTKADMEAANKFWKEAEGWGVKRHMGFWTLGRYDAVFITEAPDEKTAMKAALWGPGLVTTETLVAVNREEAASWVK